MCAILGVIHRDAPFFHESGISASDVYELLEKMQHRGRDNTGYMKFSKFALGHNRLAINDLSENANQPLYHKGVWLVVNGEIWNYPELRYEYITRGYEFTTSSDSEIILFLYMENELSRLDGMFSFILHDTYKDLVLISRDWLGKLPLFELKKGNRLYYSSELKPLKDTLHNIKNVKFVPKNSLITIDLKTNEKKIEKDYYFTFNKSTVKYSQTAINDTTYDLLDKSVRKRLLSDVPIATCLSGGIDSSVIAYLLKQYIPDLVAYTVNFDSNSEDLHYARIVAEFLKIPLVEVEIPKKDIIERFKEVIKVIEYPSAVQTEVGILLSYVAAKMSQNGVKVTFSGEGADEAYGSYGRLGIYRDKPDWIDIKKELFEKQYYGNLLRGNNIFMYYGTIELRTPFFDRDFLNFTTNLDSKVTAYKQLWKLPLAGAFKGKLPDEILCRKKVAFQTGTNFKDYIEDLVLNDPKVNINKRTRMYDVTVDHYKKYFHCNHRKMREYVD